MLSRCASHLPPRLRTGWLADRPPNVVAMLCSMIVIRLREWLIRMQQDNLKASMIWGGQRSCECVKAGDPECWRGGKESCLLRRRLALGPECCWPLSSLTTLQPACWTCKLCRLRAASLPSQNTSTAFRSHSTSF